LILIIFFLVPAKLYDDRNGPFAVFPVAYVSTSIITVFFYCTISLPLPTHHRYFYQCLIISFCAVIR